ncbi:MAG: phage integrase N-terminal SAM-like domain-containing protein [Blastocatellia bacterium]|nr:phage integrase N-terminal SAM-like domain-containing protein [Blastocatellia bacterium]
MSASQPKLLDLVRAGLRCRHYSLRTETAYLDWIKRFIRFHGKRHPQELGAEEVAAFLTHLAVDRQVAAATQNQALKGLLFLCCTNQWTNPGALSGQRNRSASRSSSPGRKSNCSLPT